MLQTPSLISLTFSSSSQTHIRNPGSAFALPAGQSSDTIYNIQAHNQMHTGPNNPPQVSPKKLAIWYTLVIDLYL